MNDLTINIPQRVHMILNTLNSNGYEAYIVGGCVRDSLLNINPQDWDITTSALPTQVKNLFTKTIDTGIKHGTVTVLLDKEPFEVTTYRIDGDYLDNRRPSNVVFTNNLIEDLKRRDFTINAMAYHPKEGLIDHFNGQEDLKGKIIRCVGQPQERFDEDALRMLRAVRFAAKLNFEIDNNTAKAIVQKSVLIENVSAERIRDELNKLIMSDHPEKIIDLSQLKLLQYIFPEFNECIGVEQNHDYHIYDVSRHIIKAVKSVDKDIVLRWTMLLHDIGKPSSKTTDRLGIDHFYGHVEKSVELAKTILKRLKFDNKTIKKVVLLVKYHDYWIKPEPVEVRKAVSVIGKDLFNYYIKVQEADIIAQNPKYCFERMEKLQKIKNIYDYIIKEKQCVSIRELAINGNDLKSVGIQQGSQLGVILNRLLDMVIKDPKLNNKEELIKIVRFYKNK